MGEVPGRFHCEVIPANRTEGEPATTDTPATNVGQCRCLVIKVRLGEGPAPGHDQRDPIASLTDFECWFHRFRVSRSMDRVFGLTV